MPKAHRTHPVRDPSLPPIPKKSSKTAVRSNFSKAIPTCDQSSSSSLPAKEYRNRMEEMYEVCMEALPLPPPPPPSVEIQHSNCAVDSAAIDRLPLPPPPEELLQDFGFHTWRLTRRAGSSEMLGSLRDRSVSSSQASVVENRNVKLPEAPIGFAHRRCASDAMFNKDVKSSNEAMTSPKSSAAGVQQGSRLRLAIANGRSASQLPANHS